MRLLAAAGGCQLPENEPLGLYLSYVFTAGDRTPRKQLSAPQPTPPPPHLPPLLLLSASVSFQHPRIPFCALSCSVAQKIKWAASPSSVSETQQQPRTQHSTSAPDWSTALAFTSGKESPLMKLHEKNTTGNVSGVSVISVFPSTPVAFSTSPQQCTAMTHRRVLWFLENNKDSLAPRSIRLQTRWQISLVGSVHCWFSWDLL